MPDWRSGDWLPWAKRWQQYTRPTMNAEQGLRVHHDTFSPPSGSGGQLAFRIDRPG